MAVLQPRELDKLRQALALGEHPTWDKPTVNAALQGAEDVLETQGFDASVFVTVVDATDARAERVEAALAATRIPADLVPVVEDWLLEHSPSTTTRSLAGDGVRAWVTANRRDFAAAVSGMPTDQRVKIIRLVIERRVEAVV